MKATLDELIDFCGYLQPNYPSSYHKMQALAFIELRRQTGDDVKKHQEMITDDEWNKLTKLLHPKDRSKIFKK